MLRILFYNYKKFYFLPLTYTVTFRLGYVMETIHSKKFSLKQIFKEHWYSFKKAHKTLVTWYIAYNVWKILNCREPDGLGYMTFACPVNPEQVCQVSMSCKSRFCSVCAKVQIDKWVSEMNRGDDPLIITLIIY